MVADRSWVRSFQAERQRLVVLIGVCSSLDGHVLRPTALSVLSLPSLNSCAGTRPRGSPPSRPAQTSRSPLPVLGRCAEVRVRRLRASWVLMTQLQCAGGDSFREAAVLTSAWMLASRPAPAAPRRTARASE
jgi:hypothetical protein